MSEGHFHVAMDRLRSALSEAKATGELPDPDRPFLAKPPVSYSWAATYSAGSDAYVYRRYKGSLPEYAQAYAKDPPPHVVAFCEEHNVDVAVDDELVPGRVRKARLFSDETP